MLIFFLEGSNVVVYNKEKIRENALIFKKRTRPTLKSVTPLLRVIETTFGILVTLWRIFNTPINASVANIQSYINCTSNYLRQTQNAIYCPADFVDSENSNGQIKPGHWREKLIENKNALLTNLTPVRGIAVYRKRGRNEILC